MEMMNFKRQKKGLQEAFDSNTISFAEEIKDYEE